MKNWKFDYILLAVSGLLLFLGILILASVSASFYQGRAGGPTYYLFHQIIYGLLPGIILGFIAFKINLAVLKKFIVPAILINLLLMVLVFFPKTGLTAGGASRWLNLGFISFQPSEFLKLAFILYLAAWLSKRTNWKTVLVPFFAIIGVIAFLLIKQSDLSTLGVIVSAAVLMYFSAGVPFWHIFLVALLSAPAVFALIRFVPYRMKRLKVLLDLIKDPMGIGYQIKQVLIAIGSGGILGLGLGMSEQKYGFIPQSISDSIFAIFAEETGFAGSLILILLYLFLLWRTLKIAKNNEDKFCRSFAVGISSWICLQAFINISSMIGIIPLLGIPLPFISYGGSHIIAELTGIGILLNISKKTKKMIK